MLSQGWHTPEGWGLGGQEARIRDEMARMLFERAEVSGVTIDAEVQWMARQTGDRGWFRAQKVTLPESEREFASYLEQFLGAGINPLTGERATQETLRSQAEMIALLRDIRDRLPGMRVAPPLVMPQAAPRPIQAPLPPAAGMPAAP